MIFLILLILSAVLSVLLINYIPFGLEKRQKKLISLAAPIISCIGLAFNVIAAPWQSGLVMILLAGSVSYVLITRATEIPGIVDNPVDAGYLPSDGKDHLQKPNDQVEDRDLNEIQISRTNQEETQLAEDISFLEVRNNEEFEWSQLEVIPVLNFEGSKDQEKVAYDSQPS